MDLWRWAPVPSGLPISAVSSTSVNAINVEELFGVMYEKLNDITNHDEAKIEHVKEKQKTIQ